MPQAIMRRGNTKWAARSVVVSLGLLLIPGMPIVYEPMLMDLEGEHPPLALADYPV